MNPIARSSWLTMSAAWGWLGMLWLLAKFLPLLPPWAWLLALLLMTALPAWGLWLSTMLHKRALRLQFSVGAWVWRWLSGPWWPAIKALALALVLVAAALWQAYFLAPWEWGVLALAPLVHGLVTPTLDRVVAPQFIEPALAWHWRERLVGWLIVLLLGGLWLALMLYGPSETRAKAPTMTAEHLDSAIATIQTARSGLVRWGLDTLLALHVTGGALRDLPQSETLRLLLIALSGPGLMSLCAARVLQGASGLPSDLRKATRLRPASHVRGAHAALLALVAVLGLTIYFGAGAELDGTARRHASPLALQRLPQCERIGKRFYTVGSSAAVQAIATEALRQTRGASALCTRLKQLGERFDHAIERYLDWYFSLGAEWARVARLLTDGVEPFLQQQLEQFLQQTPGLQDDLALARQHREQATIIANTAQQRIDEVLAQHHLALNEGQCLVQTSAGTLPTLDLLGEARVRMGASAIAGLSTGTLVAAIATKAASKASLKAAAKVLAKAAAKKGLSKAGAVAAGAALGSILPGAGTAVGALAGAAVGAVLSVGIDWTALRAEEFLTRDKMHADLRAATQEKLDAMTQALGCARP